MKKFSYKNYKPMNILSNSAGAGFVAVSLMVGTLSVRNNAQIPTHSKNYNYECSTEFFSNEAEGFHYTSLKSIHNSISDNTRLRTENDIMKDIIKTFKVYAYPSNKCVVIKLPKNKSLDELIPSVDTSFVKKEIDIKFNVDRSID